MNITADAFYVFITLFIGCAMGFQSVYEKYQKDSLMAVATFPGAVYLISRGLLPSLVFMGLLSMGKIHEDLILTAIGFGAGTEVLFRMTFYVRKEKSDNSIQEVLRGPFDLLRWYQNLFLEIIFNYLASKRKKFVERHFPKSSTYTVLYETITTNLESWGDATVRAELSDALIKMQDEYNRELKSGNPNSSIEKKFIFKVCYCILHRVGRKGYVTLIS